MLRLFVMYQRVAEFLIKGSLKEKKKECTFQGDYRDVIHRVRFSWDIEAEAQVSDLVRHVEMGRGVRLNVVYCNIEQSKSVEVPSISLEKEKFHHTLAYRECDSWRNSRLARCGNFHRLYSLPYNHRSGSLA